MQPLKTQKYKISMLAVSAYILVASILTIVSARNAQKSLDQLLLDLEGSLLLSLTPHENLLQRTRWIIERYRLQGSSPSAFASTDELESNLFNMAFGMDYEYFLLRNLSGKTIVKLHRHSSAGPEGTFNIIGEEDFPAIGSASLFRHCSIDGKSYFCIADLRSSSSIINGINANYSLVAVSPEAALIGANFKRPSGSLLFPEAVVHFQLGPQTFSIFRTETKQAIFSASRDIDSGVSLKADIPLWPWIANIALIAGLSTLILTLFAKIGQIYVRNAVSTKSEQRYLQARHEFLIRVEQEIQGVIHDIRSPMAALNMMIDDEQDQRRRGMLLHLARRMNGIMGDLELKSSEVRTKQEPSHLRVDQLLRLLVHEKNREVNEFRCNLMQSSQDAIWTQGFMYDFGRVISNLLNNALEASSPEAKVDIHLRAIGDHIEIKIIDQGCGIAKEHLDKVFEKGFSLAKEGSGIGLFHAKIAIEKMLGQIKIKSTLGKGTEVVISLPLSAAPNWNLADIHLEKYSHVVVIDDDEYFRNLWRQKLQNRNVKVTTLKSPSEIPSHWIHQSRTLIIIDNMFENQAAGIDFIRAHRPKNCLMFTSSWYESEVQKVVESCGVKLHSKHFIDELNLLSG